MQCQEVSVSLLPFDWLVVMVKANYEASHLLLFNSVMRRQKKKDVLIQYVALLTECVSKDLLLLDQCPILNRYFVCL